MREKLRRIVALTSGLNFANNCLYQFFTPIFIERALLHPNITEYRVGLIMALFPVAMVLQSLCIGGLEGCLGCGDKKRAQKRLFMLSTMLGAIVCSLCLSLDYMGTAEVWFAATACLIRVLDGARESQGHVVSVVYFSEKDEEDDKFETTDKMNSTARALSIYKVFGAVGFVAGSLIAPVFLNYFGFQGTFGLYGGFFFLSFLAAAFLLPSQVDR
jgi:MFS family permease